MADPFSIVASTVSIVDVCVRLGAFLIEVKKGSDTVDSELDKLIAELNSLNAVSNLIRENFEKDIPDADDAPRKDRTAAADLWRATGDALRESQSTLNDLDSLIKKILGENGSSTTDKVRRYFRKLSKADDLHQVRQRLNNGHNLLQIVLTAINM